MREQARYNRVARWLHWVIALLVITNILIGMFHDGLQHVFPAIAIHKAIGITVLALTLVRIAWRVGNRPPALPDEMPGWEKGAAHATHAIFYVLLLVMPFSGWVMVSAGDRPLRWFGLFDIPKLAVAKGDQAVDMSHAVHGPLGLIFGALVVVHIAAALRHHLILKDGMLRRMLG
jgi:cytochrome b561